MMPVKEQAKSMIDELPDDVSIEEILQELALRMMIDRGIADSDNDRVISDDELEKEIEQW
jgi:hypothetical protein